MEEIKTKVCQECGRELPIEMFNKTSSYTDGYLPFCKDCARDKFKRNEFMNHNLALERFPWPFDKPWHEMDIKAIQESIKMRKIFEKTAERIIYIQKKKKTKKNIC